MLNLRAELTKWCLTPAIVRSGVIQAELIRTESLISQAFKALKDVAFASEYGLRECRPAGLVRTSDQLIS
jgi:hypothetical protein